MPLYSYLCNKCGKYFEIIIPLKDCDKEVECPHCKENLKKILMPVMFKIN
jgi:putative FmdB family regulatory protein